MMAALRSTTAPKSRPLRVGFLALTDAAPLIVAQELGLFARHGLRVTLQREVGWATIREKIIYGELDAAQAPAPMLWSAELGLGGVATRVLTAFVFNRHGNALTLSTALGDAGVTDAASLRAVARHRRGESRITLGVVYAYSTHHLHLLQWLRAAGIDAEREVRIAVVPPAQMFRNLQAGTIDGYWSGEPWNSIAVRAGAGWIAAWSAAHSPGHMEKVLLVTADFAEREAAAHRALVAASQAATCWCEDPANHAELAALLGRAEYLNTPARAMLPVLRGQLDCGRGRTETAPDFFVFHRRGANVPSVVDATLLQHELVAAGILPAGVDPQLPRRLFREDLYRAALITHHTHHVPILSSDLRGVSV